jgi:hypothetical protein
VLPTLPNDKSTPESRSKQPNSHAPSKPCHVHPPGCEESKDR